MSAGKSGASLWTSANVVTMVRVVAVFAWLAFAQAVGAPAWASVSGPHIAVALLYALIAGTDSLDGYLARSRGEVTDFGKFLDPIADKLVVVLCLLFLTEWRLVSVWVVVVVVAREFLVSGLRMVVASKGVVVAASKLGKAKTATTMGAIGGYLLAMALPAAVPAVGVLYALSALAMGVAVVLTLWSGADYLAKCWKYLV